MGTKTWLGLEASQSFSATITSIGSRMAASHRIAIVAKSSMRVRAMAVRGSHLTTVSITTPEGLCTTSSRARQTRRRRGKGKCTARQLACQCWVKETSHPSEQWSVTGIRERNGGVRDCSQFKYLWSKVKEWMFYRLNFIDSLNAAVSLNNYSVSLTENINF